MKSKLLLTTSIFTLSMLTGCLDEVTEASDLDASELTCKTEPLDDNSGLKIICGGDSVGVVQNGKDGKDGKDGEDGEDGKDGKDGADGKDGSSCYVTENAEINGYDVFCGDEKIGSIVNGKDGEKGADGKDGDKGENGKDGKDGADGKDGSSCTIVENAEINGYDVICGDEKVGELRNGAKGADGKNGENGKDGNDGSSCTVKTNDDINGYDVFCGDKKVGELRNGAKGENGKDGKDGADGKDGSSCTIAENAEIDGYDVFCGNKKVGELRNGAKGADGKNGENGKDGNDGSSCTVKANDDIDGYDVICGDKKVGELRNGAKGADGKNGENGKDGNNGTSCSVKVNDDIDGYDVICGNKKVGELRNGKDAVPPSSSSTTPSSSSEVSSSSEISSSSETPSSSSVEQLSEKCKTLRATTDVFNSLYDVLGCTRSDEKVAIILRHAQRDIHKYGDDDGLIEVGRQQAKQVGEKLKELNLDDFYYMYTNVKRTAETAQIIAINKGENVSTDINDWHKHSIANLTEINQNLKESWYVKPNQNASNCKGGASWGWSSYSKIAYQEYDDDNNRQNCENAFYPIDTRIETFIENYFTYKQMHKYTLAISHDQYLVPFVITISNKKIHNDVVNSKYDLRFHLHDRDINWNPDFNYWINYLAGVVLIVDADNNVIKLPVKALDDGFLRKYENP